MYTITKKFTDFLGNERTQSFRFNYRKDEIAMLELGTNGTFTGSLKSKTLDNDKAGILSDFKRFLVGAYGELDDDGCHFNKSQEISNRFESHIVFSEIYEELMTDSEKMTEFVSNVLPLDEKQKFEVRSKLREVKDPEELLNADNK